MRKAALAGLLLVVAAPAACSAAGTGGAASDLAVPGAAAVTGAAGSVAFAPSADAVDISTCKVSPSGHAQVEGTITNSGSRRASFIASVDISQGGVRVDGVGLVAVAVEPGEAVRSAEQGIRSGLKGKLTCTVVDVSAVPSGSG